MKQTNQSLKYTQTYTICSLLHSIEVQKRLKIYVYNWLIFSILPSVKTCFINNSSRDGSSRKASYNMKLKERLLTQLIVSDYQLFLHVLITQWCCCRCCSFKILSKIRIILPEWISTDSDGLFLISFNSGQDPTPSLIGIDTSGKFRTALLFHHPSYTTSTIKINPYHIHVMTHLRKVHNRSSTQWLLQLSINPTDCSIQLVAVLQPQINANTNANHVRASTSININSSCSTATIATA